LRKIIPAFSEFIEYSFISKVTRPARRKALAANRATAEEKAARASVPIPDAGGRKKIPIAAGCQCQFNVGYQTGISVFMRRFWTAVAERSDDTAFRLRTEFQSGVALHFPPQSKNSVAATPRCVFRG
jgi:hypothetical protein